MFSHGFMSFAAIGVTVACLVIMGTFSLVAYNANENLKDLQKENAVLAFVEFVILLASVLFFIFPFEHAQFIFNARTFNYKITHA